MPPTPAPSIAGSSSASRNERDAAVGADADAPRPNGPTLAEAQAFFDALDPATRLLMRVHLERSRPADAEAPLDDEDAPPDDVDVDAAAHAAHDEYLDAYADADYNTAGQERRWVPFDEGRRGEGQQEDQRSTRSARRGGNRFAAAAERLGTLGATGVTWRPLPRSSTELGRTGVELPKTSRGRTPGERTKTRKLVVVAIEPGLRYSELGSLTTSAAILKHQVVKELQQFAQAALALHAHALRYDCLSIFCVPKKFDTFDIQVALECTVFTDVLKDPAALPKKVVHEYAEHFLQWASIEDIESDNWMSECIKKSMDDQLLVGVESDMAALPRSQRCALTLWYSVAHRINRRTQESQDALIDFIKTFDVRKFDNENVEIAVLMFEAVARALGDENVPSNAPRKLLDGMGQASCRPFRELCASMSSIYAMASFRQEMGSTPLKLTMTLIPDLTTRYFELLQGGLWDGTGHEGASFYAGGAIPNVDGTHSKADLEAYFIEALSVWKGVQLLPILDERLRDDPEQASSHLKTYYVPSRT